MREQSGEWDGGGGSGVNASSSRPVTSSGSRRHLRSGILSFGRRWRLSFPPPEPGQFSSMDGDGPNPSAASRPSAPSQGPSPSLPSRGVLLGARRVRGRVRQRVAESRPEGSGQLAAGGASSEGGGDSVCAESRLARVAALPSLRGHQFSDSRTDCGAGGEILGVGLKGVFLVWKQCRGPSACFIFSYFYLSHVDSQCFGIVPSGHVFLMQRLLVELWRVFCR